MSSEIFQLVEKSNENISNLAITMTGIHKVTEQSNNSLKTVESGFHTVKEKLEQILKCLQLTKGKIDEIIHSIKEINSAQNNLTLLASDFTQKAESLQTS